MCLTFSFELTAASIQGAGELVRANHLIKEQENALLEKARFDLIGRIASGTIHDMRNLLAIISLANGNLETQCRDAGPTLSLVAQQRAAIEIMELELGNLYGFARDGFPAAAMPGAFSPGQVLSSLERMLQSRLEVRNIRLVLDVPFTLNLAGSGSHFMQVALNLLFNSVDALGSGGTIEVNAVKDGKDRALLRFIDDGPGISEEIREKVFEFLYTTKMAGTGIGLYVARRIVEAYLGTISVGVSESGCLIELWWPLSET